MFNFWLKFVIFTLSTIITVKCVSVSSDDSKNKTVTSNTTNLFLVYPIKQLNPLKEGKILKLDISQDLSNSEKENSKKIDDKNIFVVLAQSSNKTINKNDKKEHDIQLFPVNNEKFDDLIADESQIHEIIYSESTTQKSLPTHNFKDSTTLSISSTTGIPNLTKFHSNRRYKSQFKTKINQISTTSSPPSNSLARDNQTRIILENRRMSLLSVPRSPFLKKPIPNKMNKTQVDDFDKVLRDSTTTTMEKNEMKIQTPILSSMARNGSGGGAGSDERRNLTARRRAMRHFY